MGADLSLCIEVKNDNGDWTIIAGFSRIYRGDLEHLIRKAGHEGFPDDVDAHLHDILDSNEDPDWVIWFSGEEFEQFSCGFNQYCHPDFRTGEDPDILFDTGDLLPAAGRAVMELVARRPTRVICWYGS